MAAVEQHVPSPADLPAFTAAELVKEICEREGRILRMREICVFVLTKNAQTAEWLLALGGKPYRPVGMSGAFEYPAGSFRRAPEAEPEWDIYVHMIPVRDSETETVWEAAGRLRVPTIDETKYV